MANPDLARGALLKSEMPTRKQTKAKRDRDEAKVKRAVRAACVERDEYCRLYGLYWACRGVSEWAHMPGHLRSQTRGMAPEQRHQTTWTTMLCARHHDALDGRTLPKLAIKALTDKGADGPLKFTYRGRSYSE